MTAPAHRQSALSKTTLVLLGVGILLIVVYVALDWFNVAGIGAPTDIGGGLILLAGYVLVGIGVVTGIVYFVRRKRLP